MYIVNLNKRCETILWIKSALGFEPSDHGSAVTDSGHAFDSPLCAKPCKEHGRYGRGPLSEPVACWRCLPSSESGGEAPPSLLVYVCPHEPRQYQVSSRMSKKLNLSFLFDLLSLLEEQLLPLAELLSVDERTESFSRAVAGLFSLGPSEARNGRQRGRMQRSLRKDETLRVA